MNYASVLERIGKTMGRAPRSLLFRGKWRLSPPRWLADDPYTQELFRHQDALLKRGRLAWGAVVFPAVMSSAYVDRAHLPDRRLGGQLLPLLVLPEVTETVMIVPGFLWPSDFIAETWS